MSKATTPLTMLACKARPEGLQRLDKAIANVVTDEDLAAIVTRFKDKAKEGHVGSANFLLKLLGAESGPVNLTVNQFYNESPVDCDTPANVVEVELQQIGSRSPLERISNALSAAGPQRPSSISELTQLDTETVIQVLDAHPTRFSVKGDLYDLAR